MSLNWDETGRRVEGPAAHFKVVTEECLLLDEDGRKTGETGPREVLRRRIRFNRGGWSKWAKVGEFDTEDAAKAYAEGF